MKPLESKIKESIRSIPLSPEYSRLCPNSIGSCYGAKKPQFFGVFCQDNSEECMIKYLSHYNPEIIDAIKDREGFDNLVDLLRKVQCPRPSGSQEASESMARTFNEAFLESIKRGTAGGCIE